MIIDLGENIEEIAEQAHQEEGNQQLGSQKGIINHIISQIY